jgi:ribonucleoside-diphosphate reductase alpha chain
MATSTALGISRHFTVEGKHPYDEIEWETRDSRITHYLDGSVAFEQKDVEFPVFWSLNATNIVAQKYFCGTPGTKTRERSLRQLIDRVADTITKHGLKEDYFVSQDEADVFNQELKHILVNQKAAFNSPVWFNIGTKDRAQQASACFILRVEDTMEGILEWYREEGMIFKGGSGSGINLSTIRSSYEILESSAGAASGPVSFMRGADASAGAIKSGGKTRRAAKMVILNVDHPDVEEFIWSKAIEERKARVLRDAGFDMDLDGKDAFSIQYQNANNSVRVTDDFMRAVENGEDWDLKAVKTGETIKTVKARDLMQQIAQSAWECADPGMQYDTTINKWHTASNTGRINGSNPCSEYMHLDNSACNLASINLLKFLNQDGSFDVVGYRQTAEIMITAQEILVGYSVYPTEKITKNAKDYRELGLGYANLGALLMAQGLPYDSDEGRAQAAALTAIMTGHAYATSAKIARRVGTFAGYKKNREPMQKVLEMHRAEVSNIDPALVAEDVLNAAQIAWDEAVEFGREFGVRNSQATVLAPTGTIGLMMDCDTTGVEPDLGLVKLKKLVGGGTMSIVNQTVPRALKSLGYSDTQVQEIIKYIDDEKTIMGAPYLKVEHLPVFACSMGDNVIHYNGHIKMMGAVQPFISGAISKTVNMPESVSVEEVEQLYVDSWKLGLKAVAIYRDNCKVAQPLAGAKKEDDKQDEEPATEPAVAETTAAATVSEPETKTQLPGGFVVKGPMRRELPMRRNSKTFKFVVGDSKGYFTVGEYDDGRPGELFIRMAISNGLQYGVPLKDLVRMFTNMSFTPSGITSDQDIPVASSIVDYVFRRLALEYLSEEDRLMLGITHQNTLGNSQASLLGQEIEISPEAIQIAEASIDAPTLDIAPQAQAIQNPQQAPEAVTTDPGTMVEDNEVEKASPDVKPQPITAQTSDAPLCYNCGNKTIRAGSCYVCTACGTSTGCG